MIFIQKGKPTQNARCERFNGSFRHELLDCYIFHTIAEVKSMALEWMEDYNRERPYESLNNLTPIEALDRYNKVTKSLG